MAKPTGIDARAHKFLLENGRDVWFGTMFNYENGQDRMESFVNEFGKSTYGELAIYQLGSYYLYTDQLSKAMSKFDKIKLSSDPWISPQVKNRIKDTQQRIARMEKGKP